MPLSIERHKKNPDYADGMWAFVNVDLSKLSGKNKRVNITIPKRILTRIDAFAASHNESRSGLIANAAIEYIATRSEAQT